MNVVLRKFFGSREKEVRNGTWSDNRDTPFGGLISCPLENRHRRQDHASSLRAQDPRRAIRSSGSLRRAPTPPGSRYPLPTKVTTARSMQHCYNPCRRQRWRRWNRSLNWKRFSAAPAPLQSRPSSKQDKLSSTLLATLAVSRVRLRNRWWRTKW